jgi:hypothetical protein
MTPAARCIVKATSPAGLEYWVCAATAGGFRTFGARSAAEVFASRPDAHTAIDSLPGILGQSGVAFTVEAAE